jgi:uncharacterized membrane protein
MADSDALERVTTADGGQGVSAEPRDQSPEPRVGMPERRAVSDAEFGTAMIHFYRGEISRANVWRQRLDATFNWAVLSTGTTLSFAFGNVSSPHVVILINSLLIAVFLFIEARRYRYYEVWSSRVRVIETDYFAAMLSPKVRAVTPRDAWAEHLAEDLLHPHFTVGLWEAVGRRLRRNYIWVFALLALSWHIKIAIHPSPVASFREFLQRAAVGSLAGYIVIAIGVIYNGLVMAIAVLTAGLNDKGDEVSTHGFDRAERSASPPQPERRALLLRRQRGSNPDVTATFGPSEQRSAPPRTASLKHRD